MFEEDQYVIGDSGYQALPHLVCAFERADLVSDKEDFNTCIAKCQVTNEHCICVLKSRWHSLKKIRVQLNSKNLDDAWMVRWVLLWAKLQNYVVSQNDVWTEEDAQFNDPARAAEVEVEFNELEIEDNGRVSRRAATAVGHVLLKRVSNGSYFGAP